jgi:ABC-2 type transport system ATP-binding protein
VEPETKPLLRVEGLTVLRDGIETLHRVSFELRAGEVLAIIGPNGAGKTTLLEAVAGLRRIDAGTVSLGGRIISGLAAAAQGFTFLLDEAELPEEVSVSILLAHAQRCSRAPLTLAAELQKELGLLPLRSARGRELSRGERRRVALFQALCTNRPVVVLDEPLGVFDPRQQLDILRILKQRAAAGTALLLSVHQMSDAEKLADRILLLCDGKAIACGTLAELRMLANMPSSSLDAVFLALLEQNGRTPDAAT